jgi:hypothetical protein
MSSYHIQYCRSDGEQIIRNRYVTVHPGDCNTQKVSIWNRTGRHVDSSHLVIYPSIIYSHERQIPIGLQESCIRWGEAIRDNSNADMPLPYCDANAAAADSMNLVWDISRLSDDQFHSLSKAFESEVLVDCREPRGRDEMFTVYAGCIEYVMIGWSRCDDQRNFWQSLPEDSIDIMMTIMTTLLDVFFMRNIKIAPMNAASAGFFVAMFPRYPLQNQSLIAVGVPLLSSSRDTVITPEQGKW